MTATNMCSNFSGFRSSTFLESWVMISLLLYVSIANSGCGLVLHKMHDTSKFLNLCSCNWLMSA